MRNRSVLLVAAGSSGFRLSVLACGGGDLTDGLCRHLVRLVLAALFLFLSFGLLLLAILLSVLLLLLLLLVNLFLLLALSLLVLSVTVRGGAILKGSFVGSGRF